ncbi:hypothetical protein [Marichromatium gracile]|uniref:General secretion pathway protein B n=1 Tax=Marichromatium gracile TaxID=1048 RepID=A0ABR5VKB7_MARGR|nr:hypothetical protein [Marichromatium gracile]KXX64653.1 hypothetical protein AY586_12910 [Marichromatium gracile]
MSYILEALRQSEQARGHDRSPPSMALAPAPAPSRWGLVATLLATLALAVALYGAWRVSRVAVPVVPAIAPDAVVAAPPRGTVAPAPTSPPAPRRSLPESPRPPQPGADPTPVAALPAELLRDIESFKRELERTRTTAPTTPVPGR